MAIWPFGRRGKRPRSQMKASDAADHRLSLEDPVDKPPTLVARKPSRKRSKRDKQRSSGSLRLQSPPPVLPSRAAAAAETERAARPVPFAYNLDNHTSLSSIGKDNFTVARPTPMLQRRSNSTTNKGTTLKKRLSKRSAREIQREQEIKALSSSPPPNPPHSVAAWGYLTSDVRRGPSVHSRNADHHASNHSLPIDSRSSMSESSDYLYTYKVNALAVLAPRPVIRYSEHHHNKVLPPRSTNPSANSMRNIADEEDWNSRKRVAELADDLDATALRELLERDRRRREKKRQQDQEKKQRRLQRRLEREQHELHNPENAEGLGIVNKEEAIEAQELRGRDKTPSPATSSRQFHPETSIEEEHAQQLGEEDSAYVPEQSGSWLRDSSKDTQNRENRFSDISAHVIGNIDDRSLRAGRSGQDPNKLSEDEVSRHRSPLYQAVASTSSARISSVAQESFSDLSRTDISEKRLSDTSSSKRMASWISFFRRPSLRKRSSREVDAPPSEFSNTSRDSFMRAQSHAGKPVVPIPIPERTFRRTGTVYRSQSKFVEHLGDYPISPPDSRMQSPTPAPFEAAVDELESGPSPRQSFTDVEEAYKYGNENENENENENDDGGSRPMSWDDNSVMLSQSLASIDSEGSWMSGNFLRRISQQQNSNNYTSWRSSTGKKKLIKCQDAEENDEEGLASDEYLDELAEESAEEEESNSVPDVRRASSSAMGLANTDALSEDDSRPSSKDNTTWHGVVLERKPTVVRRGSDQARVVSNTVVLGDYDMLDTSSIVDEEDNASPISQESETVEVKRALSVDLGRGHKHARQISAGSAKLLDIQRRASVDSRQ